MTPTIGSKWKDNDPRSTARPPVEVVAIEGDHARVKSPNGRTTSIALKNFGATHQRGFTEVK